MQTLRSVTRSTATRAMICKFVGVFSGNWNELGNELANLNLTRITMFSSVLIDCEVRKVAKLYADELRDQDTGSCSSLLICRIFFTRTGVHFAQKCSSLMRIGIPYANTHETVEQLSFLVWVVAVSVD